MNTCNRCGNNQLSDKQRVTHWTLCPAGLPKELPTQEDDKQEQDQVEAWLAKHGKGSND